MNQRSIMHSRRTAVLALLAAGVGLAPGIGVAGSARIGERGRQDQIRRRRQVRRAQQALLAEGCDPGPVDGFWGPSTSAAVVCFQKKNNLTPTGALGPRTRRLLSQAGTN